MKIFVTVCLLLVLACGEAAPYEQLNVKELLLEEFNLFKLEHGKVYADASEEAYRMNVYKERRMMIAKHNQLYHEGKVTYEMGMNQFGDMLLHEVRETMFGIRSDTSHMRTGSTWLPPANVDIPNEINWRSKGYVTNVKSQGQCGSCWAFSATGSLEGQMYKKTGKLVSLSEQNLMDCSGGKFKNAACAGGEIDQAFDYIKANNGLDTEESYPYEEMNDTCRFERKDVGATISGYFDIEKNSETALTKAVATVGPISVAIDSDTYGFMHYMRGLFYSSECKNDTVNHGVLVVGYATDHLADYYLVKNSWGERWGENGYIKMSRNSDNNCCIACLASYPIV